MRSSKVIAVTNLASKRIIECSLSRSGVFEELNAATLVVNTTAKRRTAANENTRAIEVEPDRERSCGGAERKARPKAPNAGKMPTTYDFVGPFRHVPPDVASSPKREVVHPIAYKNVLGVEVRVAA